MDECPICGQDVLVETTTLDDPWGSWLCLNGHTVRPVRQHRYPHPLPYVDRADIPVARWSSNPQLAAMADIPVRYVYCGPPAHLPRVPTPADILRGAGLDPWEVERCATEGPAW